MSPAGSKANICLPCGLFCCMIEPWTTRATEVVYSRKYDVVWRPEYRRRVLVEGIGSLPFGPIPASRHAWGSTPGYGQAVH